VTLLADLGSESGAAPPSLTVTHPAEGGITGAGSWVFLGNALTIVSDGSSPSGRHHLRCASNLQSIARTNIGTHVDGRLYVQGMRFKVSVANPTTAVDIIANADSALRINTNGTLNVRATGANVGSASPALVLGKWYYLELAHIITAAGNDYIEGWLDGISIASQSGSSFSATLGSNMDFGPGAAYGASTVMEIDDVYVIDDQGAAPFNGRLGPGFRILSSMPVADISRDAGWTDNDLSTTNLFASVDNRPPVALTPAAGAGTADTQIKNSASTTTDNYVAEMQSAREAGVGPEDTIIGTNLVTTHGIDSATATTVTSHQILANNGHPGTTEANWDPNLAATAWPTNWTPGRTITQNPVIVDPHTRPQVEIGKRTAATRVASVGQIRIDWLIIEGEHTPSPRKWPPWLKDIPRSTRLRRFPLAEPTIVVEVPTQETPDPGGLLAAGNGLTAQVDATTGGEATSGNAPNATVTQVGPGGATEAGPTQSGNSTPIGPGGISLGGTAATGSTDLTPGGVQSIGGNAPGEQIAGAPEVPKLLSPIQFLFFGPAGFRKMRRGPVSTPTVVSQETPVPGGAVVSGSSVTGQVPGSTGGETGAGNTVNPVTTASPGGSVEAGNAVVASTNVSVGGVTEQGNTATTAAVSVTPGGLVASGFAPTEVIESEPTFQRKDTRMRLARVLTLARMRLLKRPLGTTASAPTEETPIPGGAIVRGNVTAAATSQTDIAAGGQVTSGNAVTAATTASPGGASIAGLSAATQNTGLNTGGLVGAGQTPTARVSVGVGGLITGGFEFTTYYFIPPRREPKYFLWRGPGRYRKMNRGPKAAFAPEPQIPILAIMAQASIRKRRGIHATIRELNAEGELEKV
jgi:hypothetical protein